MFDIGWQELLVIAIVLIVVVGPKDLPKMLRAFGKATARMRSMANDFKSQFDEALREAELDDVRKTIADARSLNPAQAIRDAMNPLHQAGEDIRAGLDEVMRKETAASTADDQQVAETQPTVPMSEAGPAEKPKKAVRKRKPAAKKATAAKAGTSRRKAATARSAEVTVETEAPAPSSRGVKRFDVVPEPVDAPPATEVAAAPKATAAKAASKSAKTVRRKPVKATGDAASKAEAASSAGAKARQNGSRKPVAAKSAKPSASTRKRGANGAQARTRSPKAGANGYAAPNGADTTDNNNT